MRPPGFEPGQRARENYLAAKKFRVRLIWDVPVGRRTFEEIGEALFYIANASSKLELELADSEGMVFRCEVANEDLQIMLESLMDDFKRRFRRVEVLLEEADR